IRPAILPNSFCRTPRGRKSGGGQLGVRCSSWLVRVMTPNRAALGSFYPTLKNSIASRQKQSSVESHSAGRREESAGTESRTATDTANAAVAGSQSVTVIPAAASRLLLSAPASVKAGARFSLTVTVVDAYGNVVTGYRGTIRFGSS